MKWRSPSLSSQLTASPQLIGRGASCVAAKDRQRRDRALGFAVRCTFIT
jgi:hypothetical protein